MITTVISSTIASTAITGGAVAGLIILLIIRELTEPSTTPVLSRFGQHLAIYTLPLIILFAFIIIMASLETVS